MTEKQIELPTAKVDFSDAQRLADLWGIIQYFRTIMQACSRLERLVDENSEDNILIESLWTAALIRYARCFATGKRFGLPRDVFQGQKGEPIKCHQFYMDLRDKHIAHSVNSFEQTEVGLVLSPVSSSEKKVVGVVRLSMRHFVPDKTGIHQLGSLSKVAHDKTCSLAKEIENKVLEEGRKIPIQELYRIARSQLVAPGPDSVNKPRT
ncbi:MAG TPA: hypothetical protein ENH85_06800 [Candidatus Scalindua sp.]|nr:hypothetical protein [Candidatus Scalindua sp.]